MYVETYVLSLAFWLLITRTGLGMTRFLKILATCWFAVVAATHVFAYTQNHDWRNLVQAGLWAVIAVNTYLAKPIDKGGFWRDLRETAFPLFDIFVVIVLLFGLSGLYGWANTLQMTQPSVEKVMMAEGARGATEVGEKLADMCPASSFTDTLWSGRRYLECDIHEWDDVTSVYLVVRNVPGGDMIASAVVGFDNETGDIAFINRE